MGKQQKALENLEDEDYEDGIWVPNADMDNTIDAMEAMTDFLKMQHKGAIEITRLALEYCKFTNLTEDKIFDIYQKAVQNVQQNMKNPMK